MPELWDRLDQAQQSAPPPDMWRAPYGVGSEAEMAGSPSGMGSLASGLYQYLGNLAKRSFGASEQMRGGGSYDPAPAVDAALLAMGGGIGGTGEGAGTALGSGPARNLMLENADLYKELANQARTKGYATGKSAPGWDFTRPAPEKGSWADLLARTNAGWEADKARAIGAYEQAAPGAVERSPYMTDADYAEVAKPNFVLGSGAIDKRAAAAIQGIRAYHSSPYDFERFDLSKIGTGEGAQAYGHGLYFAESPAVSGQGGQYWKAFTEHPQFKKNDAETMATIALRNTGADREKAIEFLQRGMWQENYPKQWDEAVKLLKSDKPVGPRTYEVNINADPAHFLDWDKPLRDQPELRSKLENLVLPHLKDTFASNVESGIAGSNAYRNYIGGSDVGASQIMKDYAGIPGIKYLDQGSRAGIPNMNAMLNTVRLQDEIAATIDPTRKAALQAELAVHEKALQPTSNYVVFNDKLIDILRKYGIAGIAPMAAGFGFQPTGNEQRM